MARVAPKRRRRTGFVRGLRGSRRGWFVPVRDHKNRLPSSKQDDTPRGSFITPGFKMKRSVVFGAIAFGGVVGFVAALSRVQGTATLLLGSLFALFGGSFVGLYGRMQDTRRRNEVLTLVGCVAAGTFLGLILGFTGKFLDRKYLTAGVTTTTNPGGTSPVSASQPSPILEIQGATTTKLKSFKDVLAAQTRTGNLSPKAQTKLRRLTAALDNDELNAALLDAAQLAADPNIPLRDDFRRQFKEVFGDPYRDH